MNPYRYTRNTMLMNMYLMARDGVEEEFGLYEYRSTNLSSSDVFRKTAMIDLEQQGFLLRTQKRDSDGSPSYLFRLTPRALIRIERYLREDDVEFDKVGTDEDGDPTGPQAHEVGNRIDTSMFEAILGLED